MCIRDRCSNAQSTNQVIANVKADDLIEGIDTYRNTKIETEGLIIHVCGVSGEKMKLKTEAGAIIKVEATDAISRFDKSFHKQRIKVQGIVKENRVEKAYIDKIEKEGTLLCHIDNTPCKDSVWIEKQVKSGNAERLSKKDIAYLRQVMKKTGKDYVSTISIRAENVILVEDIEVSK